MKQIPSLVFTPPGSIVQILPVALSYELYPNPGQTTFHNPHKPAYEVFPKLVVFALLPNRQDALRVLWVRDPGRSPVTLEIRPCEIPAYGLPD